MTGIQHTQEYAGRSDTGRLLQAMLLFLVAALFSIAYLDTVIDPIQL